MLWGERFGRITPLIFHPSSPTITLGKTLMNINPFNFNSQKVRTVQHEDGSIWFVLKDICDVLGIENSRHVATRLKNNEKNTVALNDGNRGNPNTTIVSESGFYKVVLRSDKPKAEPFSDWVTSEVLPSIRKTGSYSLESSCVAKHEVQATFAEMAMRTLNLSESGKIGVIHRLCQSNGVDSSFLPNYSESEDNRPAKAIKRILDDNDVGISAIAANKLLMAEGLLEEKERPSTGDKVKKFKSVTDKGLEFGKNVPNPKNERETTPLWYVDTSKELLEKIGI